MPIAVNAECFSTSPTLISFPIALWPLQLWSDEVEKVSTQLKLYSNLFGVGGCCGFLPAPHVQRRIGGTLLLAPHPVALRFSATLPAAWEELAPWASWLYPVCVGSAVRDKNQL